MGVFLLPLLVTRSDDQTHGELFSFVSYGQIQQSVVNPFPGREICATLPSEIRIRNPAGSFFFMEQPASPSSIFRLGGLCVVDLLQRQLFHVENFQWIGLSAGADTCEYGAHPGVAPRWTRGQSKVLDE